MADISTGACMRTLIARVSLLTRIHSTFLRNIPAKRREEEAKRLSMYKAHQISQPKEIIPCTNSDSETESESVHTPTAIPSYKIVDSPDQPDSPNEPTADKAADKSALYRNLRSELKEDESESHQAFASGQQGTPAISIVVTAEAARAPPEMLSEDEEDQDMYLPVVQ